MFASNFLVLGLESPMLWYYKYMLHTLQKTFEFIYLQLIASFAPLIMSFFTGDVNSHG